MTKKDNTIQPHITTKFETMAQTHDKNMTSWQSNTTLEDSLDYTDSFSQSFLSPMSTTLQDLDDLDYSTTTGGGGKKKLVQALPVYEEAPTLSDYSMAGYVGPMDIHHQRPQRHSMLAGGSKQYNIFIHDPKLQQQHQHPQLYTNQPYPHQQHTTTLINNGYNSSTSSSFSPPSSSTNFPMSAPANIGYEFNLNTRQQPQPNGSPNPNHHLPMSMSPSSQQVTDIPPSMEDDYAMQINLQAMMEKRRRRRESHNAVERRRRENINDRIQELGSLLPQAMLDEITNGGGGPHSPSTSTGHPGTSSAINTATTVGGGGNNATTTTSKPNKGAILRKSVDHIKLLQQEVNSYQRRIKELESILASYHSTKQD